MYNFLKIVLWVSLNYLRLFGVWVSDIFVVAFVFFSTNVLVVSLQVLFLY